MRRESGKHGPRVDDELRREVDSMLRGAPVESRVEEGREHEGPGEGEPGATARPRATDGDDPIAARRDLSRHLDLHAFPGDAAALLANASANDAPEHVLALLRLLPPGQPYGTVHEVWFALTGDWDDEGATDRPRRA
ncbi:MAG: DUF2795 domain-containing protein [Thermoleophilia bacterium]